MDRTLSVASGRLSVMTTQPDSSRSPAREARMATSPSRRDRELARQLDGLDELEHVMREVLSRPHPLVRHGEIVRDPASGELVPDPGPAERAAKVLADLAAYRDRITGLGDLPVTG